MQNAKRAESMSEHALSQFELTTNVVTKLNTFKLTPTAKLVLLYLTTCYNPKHKEVFPKQKTISIKLGISERSVTRAICELHKEGLILIECKCKYINQYKFTSRIVQEQAENLSVDKRQNDIIQDDNLSGTCIEQKIETKKEPTKVDDYKILRDYAIKHGAKNINAYINTLKKNGSAEEIIKQHNRAKRKAEKRYIETQKTIKLYESFKLDRVMPETCTAWVELGKKLGYKKIP